MILAQGKLLESGQISALLPGLYRRMTKTLGRGVLNSGLVVEACHRLSLRLRQGEYTKLLENVLTEGQVQTAVHMLDREALSDRIRTEIGTPVGIGWEWHMNGRVSRQMNMPLGVLFHIAAGNMDGLPFFTVIEGLLAGNINILKLPSADGGLSIRLLQELIREEPGLADYIYVIDTASQDEKTMKYLGSLANAIVVWGQDETVQSVRKLAAPETRLIEWGHKMSFAYLSGEDMWSERGLADLAHHIAQTRQLLCSSCQGIFLDTDRPDILYEFGGYFLTILERAAADRPQPDIGVRAQLTLQLYCDRLEAKDKRCIYRGRNCSVIASETNELSASVTHSNVWVRLLPREQIVRSLHRHKGHLQTAGLLCPAQERRKLSALLLQAGVTRVTALRDMSEMTDGSIHDGEYPLRRYTRVVEY